MRSPASFRYVSARGERADLNVPGADVGSAAALRGHVWSYELGNRVITGQSRPARTVDVEVSFGDPARADALRRAADRDVHDGTPGTIEADGQWVQRAYVLGFEPSPSAATTCAEP